MTDQNEIARLREVSIHDILGLKRKGQTKIACVFHNDKTPSLVIYPNNSFYCFGCGESGGGAIDFVMKACKVDFKEAVRQLQSYVR